MGHGPSGADRVGHGHANGKAAPAKIVGDRFGQRAFAAEKVGQAGDVQKQAVRRRGIVQQGNRPARPAG
jgi:hypothetical protein